MKETLFFLCTLLLLLSSCSNEEVDSNVNLRKENTQSSKVRWYGAKLTEGIQTKGVADGTKRWNPNAGIYIKFLNAPNDPQILEKVKQIASEWEEYASIKFHFVDQDKKTDVRIAFDWNGNDWLTWSYTGTDAKFEKNQIQPTAVLAGLDGLDDNAFKGDVLRLFGQILGLEYEQRHQEWSKKGYWKTESQLQYYWEDQFDGYNMDWNEIKEYVFIPLTNENTLQLMETKDIDELSVMAWPYYNRKQTSKLLANYELSDGDKAFIAQLYPKNEVALPTIQVAWVDAGYFRWKDESKTSLEITDLGREQEYLPDVCDGEQLTTAEGLFGAILKESHTGYSWSKIKIVPKFNTSNITNFNKMFFLCLSLESIPHLDTSNGTKFGAMFSSCPSLTSIPQLDTSKGTDFTSMFSNCSSLTSIPHLDTSQGTNFNYMFTRCSSLTSIPLLNTSKGTTFWRMFTGCSSLTSIPHLDTSKAHAVRDMFSECSSLVTIPHLDTSKSTDFTSMFSNCSSLTSIPHLDTSNGTKFGAMFSECSSLTTIPQLNTSKGIDFGHMFYVCSSLISIPQLNTQLGKNFEAMFLGCSSLTIKPLIDTSNATHYPYNANIYTSTPFE